MMLLLAGLQSSMVEIQMQTYLRIIDECILAFQQDSQYFAHIGLKCSRIYFQLRLDNIRNDINILFHYSYQKSVKPGTTHSLTIFSCSSQELGGSGFIHLGVRLIVQR